VSRSKPNIILIVSDQHRGDWLGYAGNPFVETPNMDRMAREGVHFTNAYCNSPFCVPSRMSMMTGRYPHHTGVYTNSDYLASDMPTFAHALSLGGYETVLCGRMHFNGPDQRHGFAQRIFGDISPSYPGGPSTDYGDLAGTQGQGLKSLEMAGPGDSAVIRYDEAVVATCEQFLGQKSHEEQKPLFLTVGFYGPHHPYVCPPEYYERALAAMENAGDVPLGKPEELHPWVKDWTKRLQADRITPELLRTARACYAGLISLMDHHVGRVLKAAESLPGETVVIYVSDHGDMAGDRGMFWKRCAFEGAIRVPIIFYSLPGAKGERFIAGERQIKAPVSLVDLAPTLISITGAPALPNLDGQDISPLFHSGSDGSLADWESRPVYSELATPEDSVMRIVIRNGVKLVYCHGYEVFMYDLNVDPQEQRDVSGLPEYQTAKRELLALLMDGWDPAAILTEIEERQEDAEFMKQWGKQVGMGKMDLWEQASRT